MTAWRRMKSARRLAKISRGGVRIWRLWRVAAKWHEISQSPRNQAGGSDGEVTPGTIAKVINPREIQVIIYLDRIFTLKYQYWASGEVAAEMPTVAMAW